MKKKFVVVFTYVEAGFGHMMPAKAISDVFKRKYGEECEVIDWNIFSSSENETVRKYSHELCGWTKKVANNKLLFMGEIFSYLIGSKASLKFLDKKFKSAKEMVMKDIVNLNPDLICSTYYSPSHFALECKKKGLINSIVATYTPDPVVYPAWDRRSDLFFVNNDQAKRIALKTGFNRDAVHQVPFVLRPNISEISLDKNFNRKNLGLEENKFTIILASGAYGTKKDKKVIEALINQDLKANVVVICGKNEELLNYCNQLKSKKNLLNTSFYPIGFTDRMFEYNAASNLFIGKSGANALVESYFFGVPTIVTSYGNPLEKSIAKYYIGKKGCGEKIFSNKKLIKRIKKFMENKELTTNYKNKMAEFNNPNGAEKIADLLYKKLKEKGEAR